MRKTKEHKAITLIALIITIVVLLILAVVAINAVTGDGIIQHATNAKTSYENAQVKEQGVLSYYQDYLEVKGDYGSWVQEKTKIINSKTGEELEVGDIVNYVSNTNPDVKWAVLGVEYGKVLLVSTTNVAMETLAGRQDYMNKIGIKRLNDEGAKYDDGIGAVADSGRSIDVDDINRVTGYNPLNTGVGEIYKAGKVGQYLNKVTYTINSAGKVEYSSAVASGVSEYQKFMRVEDGTELAQGESITVESNFYKYYPVSLDSSIAEEVKGISDESNAYELLFGDTDLNGGNPYWLGNSYVNTYDGDVAFGVRLVRDGYVGGNILWSSDQGANNPGRGVRAVVTLESNVQFIKIGENNYNITVIE